MLAGLVDGAAQLGHGILVLELAAAKALHQRDRRAHLGQGLDLEHIGIFNRSNAFVGVFVDQSIQHFTGSFTIFGIDAIVSQLLFRTLARSLRVSMGWS